MKSLHARTLFLVLLLAFTGCEHYGCNMMNGIATGPVGGGGPIANAAVLPSSCAAPNYALDGTVWQVTWSAESIVGNCLPGGQIQALCDVEWTFVADPTRDGLYEVHIENGPSSDPWFRALLCGDDLYLTGGLPLPLQINGCVLGSPTQSGNFIGQGTPPRAWLSFTGGSPPTGQPDAASGVVNVRLVGGTCEYRLVLSLAPSINSPLAGPAWNTGSLSLQGDAAVAAALARANLGLLLSSAGAPTTWLPMEMFAERPELQLELAPGTWMLAITPQPGSSGSTPLSAVLIKVHAGGRTSLDWSRHAILGRRTRATHQ